MLFSLPLDKILYFFFLLDVYPEPYSIFFLVSTLPLTALAKVLNFFFQLQSAETIEYIVWYPGTLFMQNSGAYFFRPFRIFFYI